MLTKEKPWPKYQDKDITPDLKKKKFDLAHKDNLDKIKIKDIVQIILEGTNPEPKLRPSLESLIRKLKEVHSKFF